MKTLNLETKNLAEQKVKAYLETNASDILADKINNGTPIEKDGKSLINKKTLDGFMRYATEEAKKIAEKGANYACIDDNTVYGWAIHYFEENSIEGKLYTLDGEEYKPAPTKAKKPTPKPHNPQTVPQKTEPKKDAFVQSSLFDLI